MDKLDWPVLFNTLHHDLRTPISNISSIADVLYTENLSEETQKRYYRHITAQAAIMLHVFDVINHFSKKDLLLPCCYTHSSLSPSTFISKIDDFVAPYILQRNLKWSLVANELLITNIGIPNQLFTVFQSLFFSKWLSLTNNSAINFNLKIQDSYLQLTLDTPFLKTSAIGEFLHTHCKSMLHMMHGHITVTNDTNYQRSLTDISIKIDKAAFI